MRLLAALPGRVRNPRPTAARSDPGEPDSASAARGLRTIRTGAAARPTPAVAGSAPYWSQPPRDSRFRSAQPEVFPDFHPHPSSQHVGAGISRLAIRSSCCASGATSHIVTVSATSLVRASPPSVLRISASFHVPQTLSKAHAYSSHELAYRIVWSDHSGDARRARSGAGLRLRKPEAQSTVPVVTLALPGVTGAEEGIAPPSPKHVHDDNIAAERAGQPISLIPGCS
jgi:hypothetical protein